jgi:tetratricopeptide (TPR) repeat protein
LDHPNIVTIYDVGEEKGIYYIAMQLIEGETLRELIKREGALRPERVARILSQLASALDYAHSKGVIHRDIKSSNVFIGPGDHVILTDFGIAKAADGTKITMTGMVVGTPEYMSPEQAKGDRLDYRTDIYSLGVVVYEMLTGKVPFGGTTPHAVLHKHIYEAPPPMRSINPSIPSSVELAVGKALAKEPMRRYKSCREFVAAFDGAVRGVVKVEPPTMKAPVAVPVPRRVFPVWGWAVALAVVFLVFVVILWGSRSGGPAPITPSVTPLMPIRPPTHTPYTPLPPPPTPTNTPMATPTLTPTPYIPPPPTPTFTPTPCPLAPAGVFASAWSGVREHIGCPVNQGSVTWLGEELFERGYMFWRKDTDRIYVIYDDYTWQDFADIWYEGDPEYSCPEIAPSTSPPTPRLGFGKIWCVKPGVRDKLGWALAEEKGANRWVQDFEGGVMISSDYISIAILYDDGTWQPYTPSSIDQRLEELNRQAEELWIKGQIEEAVKIWREILSERPDHVKALYHMAGYYLEEGLIDDAIAYCQEALRLDPYCINTHYILGVAYEEKGKVGAAMAEYQKVLDLDYDSSPNNGSVSFIKKVKSWARSRLDKLRSRMGLRQGNGELIFAYKADREPIIDGRLSEWRGKVYAINNVVHKPENWSGWRDLSGAFYIAWDETSLYLAVEVIDDIHVQTERGRTMYKGDEVEIQFDVELSADFNATELDDDDFQIGLSPGDFGGMPPEAYIWLPEELKGTMIELATSQTGDGYIIEAAIPWWLFKISPRSETAFGFCLSISDNDAPGTAQQECMVSTSPNRKWSNPTTWGNLILVE